MKHVGLYIGGVGNPRVIVGQSHSKINNTRVYYVYLPED